MVFEEHIAICIMIFLREGKKYVYARELNILCNAGSLSERVMILGYL